MLVTAQFWLWKSAYKEEDKNHRDNKSKFEDNEVLAAFDMKKLRPLLDSYGIYVSFCLVTYWPQLRSSMNSGLSGYWHGLITYNCNFSSDLGFMSTFAVNHRVSNVNLREKKKKSQPWQTSQLRWKSRITAQCGPREHRDSSLRTFMYRASR